MGVFVFVRATSKSAFAALYCSEPSPPERNCSYSLILPVCKSECLPQGYTALARIMEAAGTKQKDKIDKKVLYASPEMREAFKSFQELDVQFKL